MQNYETQKTICLVSGKVCLSARIAGEIINNAKKHYNHRSFSNSPNIPRRKYFCKECGCYHVTHYLKQKNIKNEKLLERKFYDEYVDGKYYKCA